MKNPLSIVSLLLFSLMVTVPAYGQVNLGTSSSATNPERSGDATTGLFSSTTDAVSISSGGTEIMRVNGTGVGIGTTSPQSSLTINKNASGVPTPTANNVNLQITGADSSFNSFEMEAYGDNDNIHLDRYDGTFSSPTALQSGDAIGSFLGGGYNGSAVSANKVGMGFTAGGNWSTSSTPTYLILSTTPVGSTTKAERLRVDTTGNVGIGTTSPANPLSVNGVIQSLTGGIKFPDGTTQTTAATAVGSTGMVLLATVDASNVATVSFGSSYLTSSYNAYKIVIDSLLPVTNDVEFELQVSTDGGSTWKSGNYYWQLYSSNFSSSDSYINLDGNLHFTNAANEVAQFEITFSNPSNSNITTFFSNGALWNNAGTLNTVPVVGGYQTAGAINAVRFLFSSGNISTGNFHLYGLAGT